ncbi:MAG: carboxylesterase/lipase family protein [Chloroflexi bacterium]|nr:carboxylesterase/lipase family protein [Chloroflexota bacterium]
MKNKFFISIISLLIIFVAWQLWPKQKKPPTDLLTEIAATSTGDVRGFVQNGLNIYLGIPYALPPTGSRRFKAPEPLPKRDGIFDAYEFGAVCPQTYDPVELDDPKEHVNNEDCLSLNIWSPTSSSDKKAVMVFIHGGGFVVGSSKSMLYHGDVIAKNGDVVFVSLNYRMGLFGYFDFSVIGGPEYTDSANNGLRDQMLALQWVKDNIAAFGGDPQNVTVFGESAGGSSVAALLGVDHPQQYFKRAIIMSGSPQHTAEESLSIAKLIRSETGITSPFLWKNIPAVGINYIQDQVSRAVGSPMSDLLFAPTYGKNNIVKRSPLDAALQGNTKGIDLMIGTMGNELSYWSFYDTKEDHICEQTTDDNIFTSIDPAQTSKIKELYTLYKKNPERSGYTDGELILTMGDDYVFRVPSIQLAEAQSKVANTYLYRAEYPVNLPDQPCQNNRAPHGSELPFVFGKINETSGTDFIGLSRDQQDTVIRERLMNELMMAWVNFAKTGNPNGEALQGWPLFTSESQPIMRFGITSKSENAPFREEYIAMSEFRKTFNVFDALK